MIFKARLGEDCSFTYRRSTGLPGMLCMDSVDSVLETWPPAEFESREELRRDTDAMAELGRLVLAMPGIKWSSE